MSFSNHCWVPQKAVLLASQLWWNRSISSLPKWGGGCCTKTQPLETLGKLQNQLSGIGGSRWWWNNAVSNAVSIVLWSQLPIGHCLTKWQLSCFWVCNPVAPKITLESHWNSTPNIIINDTACGEGVSVQKEINTTTVHTLHPFPSWLCQYSPTALVFGVLLVRHRLSDSLVSLVCFPWWLLSQCGGLSSPDNYCK